MAIGFADAEVPSGVIDGVNAVFTLAFAPSPATSLQLVRGGLTQKPVDDFTLSGLTITFLSGSLPLPGDELVAWYRYNTIFSPVMGAPTIQDLLRSSFRMINQLRPGYIYSPSELIDGLFVLNAMLDSWASDDINGFCTLIQSFTLVPGRGTYTIGPSGDFNGARPTSIDKATLVVLTNPASPLRLDIDILNAQQWQRIGLQLTPSTLTRQLFYNPTLTLGTCNFWPVPTEADQVELSSQQMLGGGFANSTDSFVAPPGYLDAVRYNLAVRLAMEWNQPLKPGVEALASEALAKIQRLNAPTPQMDVNEGVMPISAGRTIFNYRTGD